MRCSVFRLRSRSYGGQVGVRERGLAEPRGMRGFTRPWLRPDLNVESYTLSVERSSPNTQLRQGSTASHLQGPNGTPLDSPAQRAGIEKPRENKEPR